MKKEVSLEKEKKSPTSTSPRLAIGRRKERGKTENDTLREE